MTSYLLDVNLLLALNDPMHVHHALARRWFAGEKRQSWATCPITENGFVRIASHPSYPNPPGSVHAVVAILRRLCGAPGHEFWPDDISINDLLAAGTLITHGHITDVYLLGLAVRNGGKLATLDDRIPAGAVRGGAAAIESLVD